MYIYTIYNIYKSTIYEIDSDFAEKTSYPVGYYYFKVSMKDTQTRLFINKFEQVFAPRERR